ncbi:uncharacterized protein [Lepeophtheirus salmonis]|uniref:uncharacterized protein isoform X1 n=1 Tax=Lepeophtheirus salmonis TaxID=72036 RepID=UPI001AE2C048|nr:uncharacterized protein LOC121118107 [Lepeophtheirus salmonis]
MKLEYSRGVMRKGSAQAAMSWMSNEGEGLFEEESCSWDCSHVLAESPFPLLCLAQALERNAAFFQSLCELDNRRLDVDGLIEWIYECALRMGDEWTFQGPVVMMGDVFFNRSIEALAAGHPVIFLTHKKDSLAAFFKKLTNEAKFKKGSFEIPLWEGGSLSTLPDYLKGVPILYEWDSFYSPSDEVKWLVSSSGSFLPSIRKGGSPAIILDSADLDSVIESIITSIKSYNGYSVFRIPRLFIQESIFHIFLEKMNGRMKKFVIGSHNSELGVDCIITKETIRNLSELLKTEGVEAYSSKDIAPLILTSFPTNIDPNVGLIFMATPFRTSKELLSLFMSYYGEEAFVFSENFSQSMEIVHKLDFETVHINNVDESFIYRMKGRIPKQLQRNDHFNKQDIDNHFQQVIPYSVDKSYICALKASGAWFKTKRVRYIYNALNFCNMYSNELAKWVMPDNLDCGSGRGDKHILDIKDPAGVVGFILEDGECLSKWMPLIVCALSCGNVILLTLRSKNETLSYFSEKLGEGVLSIIINEDVESVASGFIQRRDLGLIVYTGVSKKVSLYLRYKANCGVWNPRNNDFSRSEAHQWFNKTKKINMSFETIYAN